MIVPSSPPFRCTAVALLCLALIVSLSGCGGSGSTLIPVEGKVQADGKALTRGSVAFHPDAKKGNDSKKIPGGDIGADGSYKLYTDAQPGAPPGWYKVTVVSQGEVDNTKPDKAGKSPVERRFSDPKDTPLSVEVTASPKAGAYELKVSAR